VKRSHVFISHSHDDGAFAELLVAKIREDKAVRPWIDTEHITAGVNILEAVRDGLSSMDTFIVLISRRSMRSTWVKEEIQCALRRYCDGESVLIMPFIIDGTALEDLNRIHPFLLNRRVEQISPDASGASFVLKVIHKQTGVPSRSSARKRRSRFQHDREIERLVRHVVLGEWESALKPAFAVVRATDGDGHNRVFERLVRYQQCPNEDLAWGARMTMETLVDLAPEWFGRSLLLDMSRSRDFSIRSSAASICLALAQFAPDRVPLDVAMKLARYDEDWYVVEPATAALKSICEERRNVLHFFFAMLRHPKPDARAHAARALRGIANKEPEILRPEYLRAALRKLKGPEDKEARQYITEALRKARKVKRRNGYKYGLGE
jgi:hypothetical protein